MSNKEICKCGTPQESILGPLLFILYMNDLPLHLENINVGMYADDKTAYFSSDQMDNLEDVFN